MIDRNIAPGILAAMTQSPQRIAAFAELDFPSGMVRIHTMLGDRPYNGHTYKGVGELAGISQLKESAASSANRLNLTLKVRDQSLIADIMNEDPNGRDCYIHLVEYDENRQIVAGQDYVFDGTMVDIKLKKGDQDKDIPAIINLTTSDWFERWAQAPEAKRTTDAAQQADHPGDRFFDQTEIIASSPLNSLPFKSYSGWYPPFGGNPGGGGDRR